ncbi:MAG TPA: copper chaperone PCu(A)C [Woeseiaceae bacterium]|nr:copper chaperone PCu(A)C [Woeseiaceae bacterium]
MRNILLIGLALLALVACTGESSPPLVASNVVVTEPLPGRMMSAAYLSLTNNSNDAILINRVSSPDFGAVELHESLLEDGVAKMRPVDSLVIAPGATVALQQGGLHLMLMHKKTDVDTVSLNFYEDTTLLLSLEAQISRRNE